MLKSLVLALSVLSFMFLTAAPALAADGLRLEARLSGSGTAMKGQARYEERAVSRNRLQQRFKVQVERAAPNTTYPILVNGTKVGSITTNTFGRAEREMRVNGDDPSKAVRSFPRLKPGAVVTVGTISGTLR
ncbi:MAG: hypothetical protein WD749_14400 [Phycisphaerales bacterium]